MTSTKPWDMVLHPHQEQVRDHVKHLAQPVYRSRLHTMMTKAQVAELEAYAKGKGLQVVWIDEHNANDPSTYPDHNTVPNAWWEQKRHEPFPYSWQPQIQFLQLTMANYHKVQQALHNQLLPSIAKPDPVVWKGGTDYRDLFDGLNFDPKDANPVKKSYQHHPAFILDLDNLNAEQPWMNNPGSNFGPRGKD